MRSEPQKVIDGIDCYATELMVDNSFYPASDFEWLHEIEDTNFWFKGRQDILRVLVERYVQVQAHTKLLEIGCGTGGVLKMLLTIEKLELYGAEISLDYLKFVKSRLPDVNVLQMDATKMPFENEFGVICAFDVIEHIENDELALSGIYRGLVEGGTAIISVPQHMWLWSGDDEKAFHKRRYCREELIQKMTLAGFKIEYVTSFVFSLLPIMAISRFHRRDKPSSSNPEFKLPKLINYFLLIFMHIDLALIKLGISLPVGGSLIAVGKKQKP